MTGAVEGSAVVEPVATASDKPADEPEPVVVDASRYHAEAWSEEEVRWRQEPAVWDHSTFFCYDMARTGDRHHVRGRQHGYPRGSLTAAFENRARLPDRTAESGAPPGGGWDQVSGNFWRWLGVSEPIRLDQEYPKKRWQEWGEQPPLPL